MLCVRPVIALQTLLTAKCTKLSVVLTKSIAQMVLAVTTLCFVHQESLVLLIDLFYARTALVPRQLLSVAVLLPVPIPLYLGCARMVPVLQAKINVQLSPLAAISIPLFFAKIAPAPLLLASAPIWIHVLRISLLVVLMARVHTHYRLAQQWGCARLIHLSGALLLVVQSQETFVQCK